MWVTHGRERGPGAPPQVRPFALSPLDAALARPDHAGVNAHVSDPDGAQTNVGSLESASAGADRVTYFF
jgi:hypothetical protein